MPLTCIVVGCGSRHDRDRVGFYSVPTVLKHKFLTSKNELSSKRRALWLAAIKRDDLTDSKLKYQRVCSRHFITGKPAALEDENNPDWVPSQNMGHSAQCFEKTYDDVERFERLDKRNKLSQAHLDPLELIERLSSLLSPEGGINSREEIPRLLNWMKKFSKKLVSKCIYLLILQQTDVTLLDKLMTSGGWGIMHTWLHEAMANCNGALVQEILELLLMSPVDSIRLGSNYIPKLVKTLSKREDLGDVKEIATFLVKHWLAIVKNEEMEELIKTEKIEEPPMKGMTKETKVVEEAITMDVEDDITITRSSINNKIIVTDGKHVPTDSETTEKNKDKKYFKETKNTEKNSFS